MKTVGNLPVRELNLPNARQILEERRILHDDPAMVHFRGEDTLEKYLSMQENDTVQLINMLHVMDADIDDDPDASRIQKIITKMREHIINRHYAHHCLAAIHALPQGGIWLTRSNAPKEDYHAHTRYLLHIYAAVHTLEKECQAKRTAIITLLHNDHTRIDTLNIVLDAINPSQDVGIECGVFSLGPDYTGPHFVVSRSVTSPSR